MIVKLWLSLSNVLKARRIDIKSEKLMGRSFHGPTGGTGIISLQDVKLSIK